MNTQTMVWLVFLAITKDNSCYGQYVFQLSSKSLTAEEGSCVELVCKLTGRVSAHQSYWFWIKDSEWRDNRLTGTVVYSTDHKSRPVHSDFVNRVKYVSNQAIIQNVLHPQEFKISICDLRQADTGRYHFRFVGQKHEKWITNPSLTLTVTEKRCLIVFNQPPAVTESETIHITCSASPSCRSDPQITDLTTNKDYNEPKTTNPYGKSIKINFTASWQDDDKEFSCNSDLDPKLIQKIRVKVNYKPEVTVNLVAGSAVLPGSEVTLECYVTRSNPRPTSYTWFKDGTAVYYGKQYNIESIMPMDYYTCQASNSVGHGTSNPFKLDVQFAPQILPSSVCTKASAQLTCSCWTVGNPSPSLQWYLDELPINHSDRFLVSNGNLSSVITVNQPWEKEVSTLLCRSNNSLGSASQRFYFRLQDSDGVMLPFIITKVVVLVVLVCTLVVCTRFNRTRKTDRDFLKSRTTRDTSTVTMSKLLTSGASNE